MGLRTASVGRPHANVMAPALTDTVRGQKFDDIPPEGHLEPASPVNGFEKTGKCNNEPASPLNTDDLDAFPSKSDQLGSSLKIASENAFSGTNMSFCSSSMGDGDDKMGLEKTELAANKIRSVEQDQLFGSNLEDDLMQQVIKSMENSDQLNNSSSDLTEVFDMNIDKDLLEQVDNMINISMDDQPDELETAQKIKENQAEALLSDLQRKHCRVERRLDFLRRRCFKMQARLMGQHVSSEMVGVFEQVHRLIKKPKESVEGITTSFSDYNATPLSASTAKMLNRKLETAKVLQANTAARQRGVPKYFGSGSIETSLFRGSTSGQINIPQWSVEHKEEVGRVSRQLCAQLHVVQDEVDSEATESSSGAESCDESQNYNNPHQQYLSIQKRSLWRYSTDRAAIAARWTWVQSQISDLEYRIRQHTDLYKQVRAAKGAVQLDEVVIRPQPVQSLSEIAGHHDYGASLPESTNAPINGYLGQLPGATAGKPSEENCQNCARTRPLGNFKRRRLLQVAGLHAISKKAARPSTVRCTCVDSKSPCALCTGRADPTHPRDAPDTLGKSEKVALLDPGYHPVLSLPEDTSQTLHLEAVMKMSEWQQRSLKMKTVKVLQKAERGETRPYEHRNKKSEHRKKYSRLKSSTVTALSEKIKKKLRNRKVGRPAKYNKRSSHDLDACGSDDDEVEATISRGAPTSNLGISQQQTRPASYDSSGGSPLLQMQSIPGFKANNRSNRVDYDIDNIVIPYSVAATTRVEKLQYKEILTPKWRLAEEEMAIKSENKNNGSVNMALTFPNEDSDTEDMTEDAVQARHDRSEHDEKKRFLSYMKFPLGYGRQRSHKRHDSLAESSGANTPDPASPRPEGGSPPATPGIAIAEDALPSIAMMRRRTVSQSRLREGGREETSQPVDYVEQPPYESRTFPLPDTEFEAMVREMPEAHREVKTNYRAQDTGGPDDVNFKTESPDSGDSESTESAIGEDALLDDEEENLMEEEDDEEEDPNDPEWTDAEKSSHRDRHHRR